MTLIMYKWTVPVDDQPHKIGGGNVMYARSRKASEVEVWTEENLENPYPARLVQVVGTGHPYSNAFVEATMPVENSILVWHLAVLRLGETELKR